MLEYLINPFLEFEFMRRSLLGCLLLSMGAAPVGVFLMLRKMSLTGDAMAHAILPGAATGFLFAGLSVSAMTIGGLVAGCLIALLSGISARKTSTPEDSSLAAFYLTSLALGVMIISLKGSNVDLLHFLFGSTLALDNAALTLLTCVSLITLTSFTLLYRALVLECVDPEFLRSVSKVSPVAHYAFLVLVVLNLVAGFQALGTLMSVGLMILPGAIARFWVRQLEGMIILACVLAFSACVIGLLASYYLRLPTSPTIILSLGCVYLFSIVFGRDKGLLTQKISFKYNYR